MYSAGTGAVNNMSGKDPITQRSISLDYEQAVMHLHNKSLKIIARILLSAGTACHDPGVT